jgi:hypothetical protein
MNTKFENDYNKVMKTSINFTQISCHKSEIEDYKKEENLFCNIKEIIQSILMFESLFEQFLYKDWKRFKPEIFSKT